MIKGRKSYLRASVAFGATFTVGAALAASLWATHAAAQTAMGPFTDAQAQAGETLFKNRCDTCHGDRGEAASMTGQSFNNLWLNRTTQDLFTRIKTTMPVDNPNSLSDAAAASLVAYVLKANGIPAGTAALTPTTVVAINTLVGGAAAQQVAQAAAPADPDNPGAVPAGGRGGRGGRGGAGGQGGDPNRSGIVTFKTGVTVPGTVAHYSPITEDMMRHPSPNDWLMHYQNYMGWSHSPLKQINTTNVKNLQLRWAWALDDGERQQMTPLVHDGVMFVTTNVDNRVQALDAKTGDLIWENSLGPRLVGQLNAQREIALYGDQVFVGTTDTNLYALDARTGKINWHFKFSSVADDKIGSIMMANGKLVVSLGRCDEPGPEDRCFVAGYDPKDGHQLWKFSTVAYTGEVGGDSWRVPDAQRAGADIWIAGTYDPDLNLVYFGTGQSKGGSPNGPDTGDKLFGNSTIAVDNDTGKLKWYYEPAPDQGLDLDEVFEKVLVNEGSQKILLTSGKKGIMWKVDRTNGQFLDYVPMVFQNVFTSIDRKTGRGTYRDDILNRRPDGSRSSCPAASGGHNWPASSYVPESDEIIFPLDQICVTTTGDMIGNYEAPASDGNIARLSAYRAKDLKPLWTIQQRAPFLTSAMTTAGGIGFVGDWDRTFRAFDVRTGKTLWTVRLPTTAQGFPTAYSVDGEEFIAVPTGYNGGSPEARPDAMLAFEKNRPLAGHGVYVFALPKAAPAPPAKKTP